MSLNASVGPWNSSSSQWFGPSCASGATAACPNPAYAASTIERSAGGSMLSPVKRETIAWATSAYARPRNDASSSRVRVGHRSGT